MSERFSVMRKINRPGFRIGFGLGLLMMTLVVGGALGFKGAMIGHTDSAPGKSVPPVAAVSPAELGQGFAAVAKEIEPAVVNINTEQIIHATGSRSKIVFKPLPQDDPKQRRPDITRARKHLSWAPKVALAQGLARTIEYFRGKV